MFQSPQNLAPSWGSLLLILLTTHSMASLGILLATMTLRINARQILFPILYFPLTTPIILAAVNSTLLYLEKREINEAIQGWIGLLCLFDVIYLTLGILLFSEIVEESE